MRINPTDPYFSFSPVKPGGFPIIQGKPFVSRFRFVVTTGSDKALLDRQWNDYANPPRVTVAGRRTLTAHFRILKGSDRGRG
jgi:hypothetical protein